MRRDVGHLLRKQPDVERVQHGAHGGDRQVGLHVLLVVPHEGADPLVTFDAQRPQPLCQPGGVGGDVGERRPPVARPCGDTVTHSDDLGVAEDLLTVPHNRGDRQRDILHRGAHAGIVPHGKVLATC